VGLTRSAIVDAAVDLVARSGSEGLTMRRLGAAMDVDATAVYRHFRDKSELMRAIADRMLIPITAQLQEDEWRTTVVTVCRRLRDALLRHPHLAAAVRDAPPLDAGEFAITETLLQQFLRAGLTPHQAALAYHSVIELAVGSAAIDATIDALDDADRERHYDRWRQAYAALPANEYPASHAVADLLYRGTADDRFTVALGRLLDGIAAQAPY
jgi:AcrR family transcriptional regulator